ncbi:MAG: adenosylcobalamin-dependent ribonucleoside-diphosphate reductase [Phycisphaerales bacterium]
MKITRKFTTSGVDPFSTVEWVRRTSRITNPDGSVVFEMKDAEMPASWSQLAVDIMVSKYFRKAGVPQEGADGPPSVAREGRPAGGGRGTALPGGEEKSTGRKPGATGPEKSARQVIHRLAGCWRWWGERHGYFDMKEDAQAFYDEIAYMMLHQMCAPNSPQWFNTGLHWAYGINGPAQGHWIVDPPPPGKPGEPKLAEDAYSHPQPHACFIQSVSDDLVADGGIMDLWVREARLFKYGSGTGTNFSKLRGDGEKLSGGGRSSGLMSWLRIGDRAASAIKSGGTTRRAAKMVCLDMDHPDIAEFINWKVREEIKVQAMVEGLRLAKQKSKDAAGAAAKLKLNLDYDFNGEAYQTVSGQNSNNSVRIPDAFFDALDRGGDWTTTWRVSGEVARVYKARELWDMISYAAWRCADPGVQFDSTINAWHTCPSAGRINASNPCSEYMFLDNTACNLASLNVLRFYDAKTRTFDVDRYEHGIDLWTIVLEISVLMAAFPSREIAELSYRYRTLGLGYANLGAMLMQAGIPYDSEEARAVCACLSAILTGRSNRQSALMAAQLGAFAGYADDRENMLRVIRNHRLAAHGEARSSDKYESLRIRPVPIDHKLVSSGRVNIANTAQLGRRAVQAWDDALALGEKHGFRNAQVTVIAPTGTIGLLMDCDTTGVEPDFALVKYKKLAGGGYFKIANESVEPALRTLGYDEPAIKGILTYLLGTLSFDVPMPESKSAQTSEGRTFSEWLQDKGLTREEIAGLEASLPGVFELSFAFGSWSLGDDLLRRLKIDPDKAKADKGFNLLRRLGLTRQAIDELNRTICGTQTVEGAPLLRAEHLPVFDCANTCGKLGKRFIAPEGHIRMMAAAQPFVSGAISKTINLPNDATVKSIEDCYRLSWELGLKANALYRDGSKLSQPLSSTSDEGVESEAAAEEDALGEAVSARREATASGAGQPVAASEKPSGRSIEKAAEAGASAAVQVVHKPMRRRLADTRRSITHKFNIAGHEGYLTVGLYDDGKPGELFITMAKEGSTIGGLMDSLGTATSVALQYGVPVESLVNKFTHQRFEPAGMTTNEDIPFAKSLVDYIFRWLGMQFIPGYRAANAPQRGIAESHGAPAHRAEPVQRVMEDSPWKEPSSVGGGSSRVVERPGGDSGRAGDANGSAHARSPMPEVRVVRETVEHRVAVVTDGVAAIGSASATLTLAMESVGDAPACDVCGTITVRSGTCYKCVNCGNSMGCS